MAGGKWTVWRWLMCACILALTCTPGVVAGKAKGGAEKLSRKDQRDVDRFVLANAVWTLYRELGHALVRLLRLPLLGSEDDAVDGFATTRMIANSTADFGDALIADKVQVWVFDDPKQKKPGEFEEFFLGVHGLFLQRYYAIVCQFVGSDPEGQRQFALDAGLPVDRIQKCPGEYVRMRDTWARILEAHGPNASRPASRVRPERRKRNITVVYEDPKKKKHDAVRSLVEDSGMVEAAVEDIMSLVALPKNLRVVFGSCGEAGAFFQNRKRSALVAMCYELLAEHADFVRRDIAKSSETTAPIDYPRIFPDMSAAEEKVAIFVLGNTLFAVYHELATALVHELKLPVVPNVPEAADGFAVISMTQHKPDDLDDQLVVAVADGQYLAGRQLETSELVYRSADDTPLQRFYWVLCLFVGSDPNGLRDFAIAAKWPAGDARFCEFDYEGMVGGWNEILEPHAPSAAINESGGISVAFKDVGVDSHAALRDVVRSSGVVESAVDKVLERAALPRDLQVVFMDCKDDGAEGEETFFDVDGGMAVICYSYLARWDEVGKDAVSRGLI